MREIELGVSGLKVPVVAVGCMHLNELDAAGAERFVATALEHGANFFDHADVYGEGACEEAFAKAVHMNGEVRSRLILQTKCGIRRNVGHDFSKKHIIESVEGSLRRLGTDYIDIMLLHRPDLLVEPQQVAEAFDALQQSGKVRHFGVSNHNPMQMELLKQYVKQPIVANQLQLSLTNATMVSQGLHVNMLDDNAVNRDGSVLDYCRIHNITIQPWSPFQYGFFSGVFLNNPDFPELNRAIDEIAARHQVPNTTIVIAWLLRHPANMQPVTGTTNTTRLLDCLRAAEVRLSLEEWYALYLAAGNILP